MAPADTLLVVAFGDSITDGTASTLNGDDRWPDDLSRRLHAAYGNRVSVVDEGIGGEPDPPPLLSPPPASLPSRANSSNPPPPAGLPLGGEAGLGVALCA